MAREAGDWLSGVGASWAGLGLWSAQGVWVFISQTTGVSWKDFINNKKALKKLYKKQVLTIENLDKQ